VTWSGRITFSQWRRARSTTSDAVPRVGARETSHKIEILDIPDSYFGPGPVEGLKAVCEAVVSERLGKRSLS